MLNVKGQIHAQIVNATPNDAKFLKGVVALFTDPSNAEVLDSVLSGAMAVAVPFVLSLSSLARPLEEKWERPSWFSNPFNLKQPLPGFSLVAACMIFYGLSSAAMSSAGTAPNWSWEIPVAGGCGVWLGVRLSMFLYSGRLAAC